MARLAGRLGRGPGRRPRQRSPADELRRPTAAGHGAAASEPNILEPQPSLAIWTVVVFVGLLLVLGRFAWKPLLEALHQREDHLEHVLHDTERAGTRPRACSPSIAG